ncbi:MAG: outer membrane beta-barrel protein [Thermoanaerobaculia bacterium]|nr:outer membrane beta-barrel protein [Thermoanaerobaculia bacterium]
MQRWRLALAAFLVAAAMPARGQPAKGKVELGVLWGRHFGGTLPAGSNEYFSQAIESDTAISYGVRLGYAFSPRLSFEFSAEKVDTRFVGSADGVFASRPELSTLQMRFVEAGARWAFLTGRFVPFVGAGAGIAVLDPDIAGQADVRDSNRLAFHLDLGFKAYLLPWIGMRVDVRPRFVSLQNGHWFNHVDGDAGLFLAF